MFETRKFSFISQSRYNNTMMKMKVKMSMMMMKKVSDDDGYFVMKVIL